MGVERSVTYWYVQRQIIRSQIALLESQLQGIEDANIESITGVPANDNKIVDARSAELLLQLTRVREKLVSLGPCPKPMMG